MLKLARDWNPQQAELKKLIKNEDQFDKARELCLSMHAKLHSKIPNKNIEKSFNDLLIGGLSEERFRVTLPKLYSIAWNIWHITRIEDITTNILIQNGSQVFNMEWKGKIKSPITDTGNAMSLEEIAEFSQEISMEELFAYRMAVGQKTQSVIEAIQFQDMKHKFSGEQKQRLVDEGGLVDKEESLYLQEFWGKMTVARVILLPITRHQVIHLNNSFKIKVKKQI